MKVRYSRGWGISMILEGIAVAGIILVLGLLKPDSTFRIVVGVGVGLLLVLMGFSMLRKHYFSVEERKIVVNALLGPVRKTIEHGSLGNLAMTDGKLFMESGGKRKRLPVRRFLADKSDWDALTEMIEAAQERAAGASP